MLEKWLFRYHYQSGSVKLFLQQRRVNLTAAIPQVQTSFSKFQVPSSVRVAQRLLEPTIKKHFIFDLKAPMDILTFVLIFC